MRNAKLAICGKMAKGTVKQAKIWDLVAVVSHTLGSFDLVVFKVILGLFWGIFT